MGLGSVDLIVRWSRNDFQEVKVIQTHDCLTQRGEADHVLPRSDGWNPHEKESRHDACHKTELGNWPHEA